MLWIIKEYKTITNKEVIIPESDFIQMSLNTEISKTDNYSNNN